MSVSSSSRPSSAVSPLATARDEEVDLSAEEEARLDADPLHRIYDMNRIEAPAVLSTVLGVFAKLVMLTGREDITDYAVEYFEHLKLARAADPRIDFDRFITTQLKILSKNAGPSQYDLDSEFSPPAALVSTLTSFSREVIRYQPLGDANLFGFALEYFTALVDDGSAESFLRKQAKVASEKQKVIDMEKKRAAIAKQKKLKAAAEDDDE